MTTETKPELAKFEDIEWLRKQVPDNWALCQLFEGTRCACEAETMVAQTIHAATRNQRDHGEPYSVKGKGLARGRQRCGTDNATAYHMLLNEGYFVEDPRKDETVIFMTQKLIDLLRGHFAGKKKG